jgi:hypothetical protein
MKVKEKDNKGCTHDNNHLLPAAAPLPPCNLVESVRPDRCLEPDGSNVSSSADILTHQPNKLQVATANLCSIQNKCISCIMNKRMLLTRDCLGNVRLSLGMTLANQEQDSSLSKGLIHP